MEILIAIFILGIVMATVLGTFTGIISNSREAEKRAELYQTGRALMDIISADIRGMFTLPAKGGGSFFIGNRRNPFLSEVGYRAKKTQKRISIPYGEDPNPRLNILLERVEEKSLYVESWKVLGWNLSIIMIEI